MKFKFLLLLSPAQVLGDVRNFVFEICLVSVDLPKQLLVLNLRKFELKQALFFTLWTRCFAFLVGGLWLLLLASFLLDGDLFGNIWLWVKGAHVGESENPFVVFGQFFLALFQLLNMLCLLLFNVA